jgi:hydroxyacylglutathione hydrolase
MIPKINMAHIITVPAFSDNYIWLLCDEKKEVGVIVDPGDPRILIQTLEKENIRPIAIILTHLHFDHANGLAKLHELYPDIPVYGPESEYKLLQDNPQPDTYGPATKCFDYVTHPLKGDEMLSFKEIGCHFQVMNIPGHTSGHIAYYDSENKNLFCGDTLFGAGCGRVFDGTYKKLHDSLKQIASLPEDTLIHCAHEYTLDNLGFAKWVEPNSEDVLAREKADRKSIDNDQATVPSLLSLELETNPFMRTHLPHVAERVAEATGKSLNNSADIFAAMRIWKDSEYD